MTSRISTPPLLFFFRYLSGVCQITLKKKEEGGTGGGQSGMRILLLFF